jgi:hypothetical protein
MRRSRLIVALSLALTCTACSDPAAYSAEVAAVEDFYERISEAQRESLAHPESDWEELIEKHRVFEEWEDWPDPEQDDPFLVYYPNETIVFVHACFAWLERDASEAARWKFRSAPLDSSSHVIVTLPNAQELGLRVVQSEGGWGVEQMDPLLLTKLDRQAKPEDFVYKFATKLFEVEAALPASLLSEEPGAWPFAYYYSNRQHLRLIDSTHDAAEGRHEEIWTPYWSYAMRWISAQHRAWLKGWKSEMSLFDVTHSENHAEVWLILRFTKDGETVASPVIAQFFISKGEGGWSMDSYNDWQSPAFFEFHLDSKGSWNFEPPKSY